MPTVLTVGTFSSLHEDHHVLLSACRFIAGENGELIVGINSVEFVERKKGFIPESYIERLNKIESLHVVDSFFENHDDSLYSWVDELRPDLLAVGSDWHSRDYLSQIGMTWKELWHLGCSIVYVPSLERVHSSDLRKKNTIPGVY